jgi:pimeloyl-ACP methyl ester carboxylesterase
MAPNRRRSNGAAGPAENALGRTDGSADWAFKADEEAIFHALRVGTHEPALREYFGAAGFAELKPLAARCPDAAARPAGRGRSNAGKPRVLILPGIMGSKLGSPAGSHGRSRVVWIDPSTIGSGVLTELALPMGRKLEPIGVMLSAYAKLALQLRIAGFDAAFHAYDWRLGLDELGAGLAERILREARPVTLIGHSMGGLVARMAVARLPKRAVRKLVMVGTPNFGAFAPVQALRGTYPFVRKVAMFDAKHSAEYLAETVFHTFVGLYHLLPTRRGREGLDLTRAASWPTEGPAPNPALLAQIAGVRAGLAQPDARMAQIIGVDRQTIVAVRRSGAGFRYDLGQNGDGTVPVALARLPTVPTYYAAESHANLPNNDTVVHTIIDLIRRGRSSALPRRWRAQRGKPGSIDDADLKRMDGPKLEWRALSAAERAFTLADLNR